MMNGIIDLTADTDHKISFIVDLPDTPGVYGPFSIVTRSGEDGQIIDANYVFGSLALAPAVSKDIDGLTVSLVDSTATAPTIGTSGLGIYFSFSLSQSLWKHDIIEIIPDVNWIPTSSPTCESTKVDENTSNLLFGPHNTNTLPCGRSDDVDDGNIYIYGLARDAFVQSTQQIKLSINSFTAPGLKFTRASMKTWEVKIWRWGTNTLLAWYGTQSGPTELSTGSINSVSWSPVTSTISSTDVVTGMTVFTKVMFTTTHTIPASGTATITFLNVIINSASYMQDLTGADASDYDYYCYINSANEGASCAVSSATQVVITFSKETKPGSITISVLPVFSANPRVSSILTENSAGLDIDSITTATTWTLGTATILEKYKFFKYNTLIHADTDLNDWTIDEQYGGKDGDYLWWILDPNDAHTWSDSTNIIVYLDFVTSGTALEQVYIATDATAYDGLFTIANLASNTPSIRTMDSTGLLATYDWTTAGQVKATGATAVAAGSTYIFSLGGTNKVALPFAASNLGTFYETMAKVTTGNLIDVGVHQFAVYVRDEDLETITMTFKPLCTSDYAGIPMVLSFQPMQMAIDFTSTTYNFAIEVTVTAETDFGTGLSYADGAVNYPVSSKAADASAQLTKAGTLVFKNLGNILTTDPAVEVFVPKGDLTLSGGKFLATTQLYYTYTSGDTTTRYYLLENTDSTGFTMVTTESALTTGATSNIFTVGDSSSLSFNFKDPATAAGDYVGVGLPQGWSIDSTSTVISLDSKLPSVQYMVSKDDWFVGNFVLGIVVDNNFDVTNGDQILAVSNVKPYGRKTGSGSSSVDFLVFVNTGAPGAVCDAADLITATNGYKTGVIDSITIQPTSATTRGPDTVMTEITITFNVKHEVPAAGFIKATVTSIWVWPLNCEVTGLKEKDDATSVTCTITGTALIITGFAAVEAETEIIIKMLRVITPSTPATVQMITALWTTDSSGKYIDEVGSSFIVAACVVTNNDSTVGASTTKVSVWPNFAGQTYVDVWLSFSLSYDIPAGSKISIDAGFASWKYSASENLKDKCWSSVDYSRCVMESNKATMTIAEDVAKGDEIELYLDSALDLTTTGTITSGILITVSYGGVTIIQDISPGKTFTIGELVTTALTITEISPDILNAGEYASYTFSFKSAAEVEIDDYIVIRFPKDFDPYIGNSQNLLAGCEPNSYYIGCSSETLGNVVCTVDHWYVKATGVSISKDINTALDLTVIGVSNPAAGSLGAFTMWHFGSDDILKAFVALEASVSPAISDVAQTLILKSVVTSNAKISETGTLTFDFYMDSEIDVTDDHAFYLWFPLQYHLDLDFDSSLTCDSVYYDESGATGTVITDDKIWVSGIASCTVGEQSVTLSVPKDATFTFKDDMRISIILQATPSPQFGLERTDGDDWDTQETDVFGEFSVWTERFEVMLVDITNANVVSKSYGVLHSGYLGLSQSTNPVDIGGYDAKSGEGRLKLTPGVQSGDITINVGSWMRSKSLILTPTTNPNYPDGGNLKYTSAFNDWRVLQGEEQLTFRIAATSSISKGLYYVNWATREVLQPGISTDVYSAPVSILVEVCEESTTKVLITIASIPTLYKGYTSIPIKVSLAQAPASDLIIGLAFSGISTGISVTPTSLSFGPDVQDLYFEIVVQSTYATTQASPVLSFTPSGTDKDSFSTPTSKTITVAPSDPIPTAATVTFNHNVKSGNRVTVSATSGQNGVLYWILSCTGFPIPSFVDLKAMTASLVSTVSGASSLNDQVKEKRLAKETDPDPEVDSSVYDFFRRQLGEHCDAN